ncbi:MAG: DEAD/DEAH box helicase family protein [Planctomycetales bacterium]|nr:DEAD/DEAH box helicase family protein [Planctomycetales bacterium]
MSGLFDAQVTGDRSQQRYAPRCYQADAIEKTFQLWATHCGVMVRLATGMGKTATASFIADEWLKLGCQHHVMVLVHETQLVSQWKREIRKYTGATVAIEQANSKVSGIVLPRVVVASRASLLERTVLGEDGESHTVSRLHKFDPSLNWLVIVDEAHRYSRRLTTCGHVFEHFERNPDHRRLGLSATPERGDGVSLEDLFGGVAADITMVKAVHEGFAVPFDQRYIKVESVDFRNLHEVAGDFSDGELGVVLSEQKALQSMCIPMLDKVGDRRNLIFCPTVENAKLVTAFLNARCGKMAARTLSGTDSPEVRERVFGDHHRGIFQHLAVCGLCREGYDDPGLRAVTIFRPTKSRTLAEQMRGRGCRPLPGIVDGLDTADQRRAAIAASDKPDCLIVDLVGATSLEPCGSTVEIYADGKPDEVIARATQIVEAGETDVIKAIDRAEDEIANEKRKERLEAALEAARKVTADMRRRARIQANVQYSEFQVNQGHGLGQVSERAKEWAANVVMPFGKFKGERLGDRPDWHLKYLSQKMPNTKIGRAAATELAGRSSV